MDSPRKIMAIEQKAASSLEGAERVTHQQPLVLPIIVGGLAAGAIDAASAFHTFGSGMPLGIASGVLGARAFQGGAGVWILGITLHFSILLIAAALYGVSSRKLPFLRVNFLVCGVFYGIAIYLFMNLIVLPLSALPGPVGPFTVSTLRNGIGGHIVMVGLPISLSFRIF